MIQRDNYSLLLLAGGKSLRMGSDKAELLYEGKTFVENLIGKAHVLGIKQIYLSGHSESDNNVEVVWDIYPGIGPLGGLHSGLHHMKTKYCLILPVDIPQIPEEFLEALLDAHEKQLLDPEMEKFPLIVERDGFLEPLIGIYPDIMLEFIEERIKEQNLSVFRMLKQWGSTSFVADIPAWQIANINTKEDYENLIHRT